MPRIQESKLNKGHQRKLKALRKSLGNKIAAEAFSSWLKDNASAKKKAPKVDPIATRLAALIGRADKKKKVKLPRGGYNVRRGFQGVILVEAATTKRKKMATAKPKKAVAKPKKRKTAAKKATPKKASRKKTVGASLL